MFFFCDIFTSYNDLASFSVLLGVSNKAFGSKLIYVSGTLMLQNYNNFFKILL